MKLHRHHDVRFVSGQSATKCRLIGPVVEDRPFRIVVEASVTIGIDQQPPVLRLPQHDGVHHLAGIAKCPPGVIEDLEAGLQFLTTTRLCRRECGPQFLRTSHLTLLPPRVRKGTGVRNGYETSPDGCVGRHGLRQDERAFRQPGNRRPIGFGRFDDAGLNSVNNRRGSRSCTRGGLIGTEHPRGSTGDEKRKETRLKSEQTHE